MRKAILSTIRISPGAQTVSHLRFGPRPIHSPYLIDSANFVGCHQFHFLQRLDVLRLAAPGATFLLNSPYGPAKYGDRLPRSVQQQIIEKKLRFFVIDASQVAREAGLKGRTNTVLQTCFFALSGVLPRDEAISQIKNSIRKTYGAKGEKVVQQNFKAVDDTPCAIARGRSPRRATSPFERPPSVPASAPEFVHQVTARMFEGLGDEIPVSLMPVDGTFPSGTAAWEKRNIADEVPVWRPELCIQCGQCSFVCPHSVIRAKYYDAVPACRRAAEFQIGAGQRARLSGCALQSAVLCRGLHRLRPVHRGLSGPQRRRSGREGDQPGAEGAADGGGARQYRLLRDSAASTIAREWISPTCAACSFCSRCSSSQAPAPAAAKRPT